jgi:hypothetical protein
MHKRMLTFFTYFDAIVVDTPIVDPAFRQEIGVVVAISDRLSRGDIFRNYLDSQWPFDPGTTTFSWPEASATLRRDMDHAAERAERAKERARAARSSTP